MPRIALVTGASRGIGRAIAVALAQDGCRVAINYVANEAAAQETLRLVNAAGGEGELVRFAVADTAAGAAAVEEIVQRHGRLDVLVNNAALAIDGLLVRVKDEDWARTIATNLTGPVMLCRAAARPMMKQRAGAIVNVVSIVGESGNAGQSAYASAKAGLVGFTKSLAKELGSRNVRVNAVSPGFIETDMTARMSEAQRKAILDSVPLGRLGAPEDVANAVAFLAGDKSVYVTGEVLRVNGGLLT